MADPGFDLYVALDWSGARKANGIAVATCAPDEAAPRLVSPPEGRHWTRAAALAWVERMVVERRALVGFDCAFSLPFAQARRYFDTADPSAADLWALVERVSEEGADLWGGGFAGHPAYAGDFWRRGPRPAGYVEPHRATELACRAAGLGAPESPFKLIGAKQVGLGALAGMRLLHRLKERAAVWPFAPPAGGSVVVEIYPRLFLRRAGAGPGKLRSWSDLAVALAALGSAAPPALAAPPSDHETDALVAAAGLRALAADEALWRAAEHDPEALCREGWIFGVPAPTTAQIVMPEPDPRLSGAASRSSGSDTSPIRHGRARPGHPRVSGLRAARASAVPRPQGRSLAASGRQFLDARHKAGHDAGSTADGCPAASQSPATRDGLPHPSPRTKVRPDSCEPDLGSSSRSSGDRPVEPGDGDGKTSGAGARHVG